MTTPTRFFLFDFEPFDEKIENIVVVRIDEQVYGRADVNTFEFFIQIVFGRAVIAFDYFGFALVVLGRQCAFATATTTTAEQNAIFNYMVVAAQTTCYLSKKDGNVIVSVFHDSSD
jgi:hypothetical protein